MYAQIHTIWIVELAPCAVPDSPTQICAIIPTSFNAPTTMPSHTQIDST
jgi:hypothetical protein